MSGWFCSPKEFTKIKFSLLILWGLSLFQLVFNISIAGAMQILFGLVLLLVLGFVYYQVALGRVWAQVVFLYFAIISSVVSCFAFASDLRYLSVVSVMMVAVQLFTCYLLFYSPTETCFSGNKRSAVLHSVAALSLGAFLGVYATYAGLSFDAGTIKKLEDMSIIQICVPQMIQLEESKRDEFVGSCVSTVKKSVEICAIQHQEEVKNIKYAKTQAELQASAHMFVDCILTEYRKSMPIALN